MTAVGVRTDRGVQAVTLDRHADGWQVEIGGRRHWASLVPVGSRWSLLVGDGGPGGAARSYEVTFEDGVVVVNGRSVAARLARPSSRTSVDDQATGDGAPLLVRTPMPGRVVRILVKPGEAVSERQSLAIVEAMKMQNELKAPRAGIVAEVRVAEGAAVEARAVLLVLE